MRMDSSSIYIYIYMGVGMDVGVFMCVPTSMDVDIYKNIDIRVWT